VEHSDGDDDAADTCRGVRDLVGFATGIGGCDMADVGIGSAWREVVLARAERIDQDLGALALEHDQARGDFARAEITARTDRARGWAMQRHVTPSQLWSGGVIEDCWRELRLAEEAFSYIVPPGQLPGRAEDALNHARFYLKPDDKRPEGLTAALSEFKKRDGGPHDRGPADSGTEVLRTAITSVLAAAHVASDLRHQDLRAFRNQLRVLASVLFVLAALFVAVSFGPFEGQFLLLPEPSGVTGGWAVVFAFGAGGLGALFSAIPSLAQIPEKAVVFNPQREQALLKVAIGAWSGFIGLVTVKAGLTTDAGGAEDATTLAGFVIVAGLFGAAQEAITRFADNKATQLREAAS
jgi:hypothetical protein